MVNEYSILISLTPEDRAWFLPDPMLRELKAPFCRVKELQLPMDTDAWLAEVKAFEPDVLVSGWQHPVLPESMSVGFGGVKFLLHLTGSVRNFVPRVLLERGLKVANWGSSVAPSVAECALLLILAALRNLPHWGETMHHQRGWSCEDSPMPRGLFRKRVGLHGFGAIGQALVRLLKPFDCQMQAYDPILPDDIFEKLDVAKLDSLEALFSQSEVVVELASNTPQNHHIVTESLLRSIPDGGCFVNVGRGPVVDEAALIRVAGEGRIGIGLDVYETEPLPAESPLRDLHHVALLPHQGGPTPDARFMCGDVQVRNARNVLAGQPLENEITVDVYDRIT